MAVWNRCHSLTEALNPQYFANAYSCSVCDFRLFDSKGEIVRGSLILNK